MQNKVVSQEEWNRAQKSFSDREKDLEKLRKEISAERLQLPWQKIDKTYEFNGPNGKESLADLFQGRSQLIIQHFMFTPEWNEGCHGCSVQSDTVDGARYHFEPKDVSFVAIGRAPIEKIEKFRKRMGWNFKFVSSFESDFNYDFHVSFTDEEVAKREAVYGFEKRRIDMSDLPAVSVLYKNPAGEIFRTYANYATGEDLLLIYQYLDITPRGRDEKEYFDWIKHHDKY